MMMSTEAMKALLKERGKLVESYLATCLDGQEMPPRLRESMLYSLQAGGKRLRPVLCLSCAALCGLQPAAVLPFASAIEMVHTYSLIHDDLPAMDDDDLRRGKPSNHKAFDEATAILAGDALLTDAFAHMCRVELPAGQVLRAVAEFARAAGSSGMVGGQEWDMLYTGLPPVGMAELRRMHAMKTGALLRASCVCGALLAGAADDVCERIGRYGAALGVAFQIADDILDEIGDPKELGKSIGSDKKQHKNTYTSLNGLDAAFARLKQLTDDALEAIAPYYDNAEFFRDLALQLKTRRN